MSWPLCSEREWEAQACVAAQHRMAPSDVLPTGPRCHRRPPSPLPPTIATCSQRTPLDLPEIAKLGEGRGSQCLQERQGSSIDTQESLARVRSQGGCSRSVPISGTSAVSTARRYVRAHRKHAAPRPAVRYSSGWCSRVRCREPRLGAGRNARAEASAHANSRGRVLS
jgi:hypothetical protein